MNICGYKVKTLRKEKGLTQKDLGDLVGVSKVTISCYEKGTRMPTLDTLVDLSNSLGVTTNYLLGTEIFAVAEEDSNISLNIDKREIDIIKELRLHTNIYLQLLENPKRFLDYIDKKIR